MHLQTLCKMPFRMHNAAPDPATLRKYCTVLLLLLLQQDTSLSDLLSLIPSPIALCSCCAFFNKTLTFSTSHALTHAPSLSITHPHSPSRLFLSYPHTTSPFLSLIHFHTFTHSPNQYPHTVLTLTNSLTHFQSFTLSLPPYSLIHSLSHSLKHSLIHSSAAILRWFL